MILCSGSYKKKPIKFIALGTGNGKIIALKIQESSSVILSNSSINRLKSNYKKLMKLNLPERLAEIKNIIPEWSKVYRTYKPEYLNIKNKYQI